jgi:hypothetical protein
MLKRICKYINIWATVYIVTRKFAYIYIVSSHTAYTCRPPPCRWANLAVKNASPVPSPLARQTKVAPGERPKHLSSTAGAAAEGGGEGRRANARFLFTYQTLSKATKNFEKRLGGGGCGSVFQGVLVSGTRVAVKRLELDVAPGAGAAGLYMTDQMRTEVEMLSQVQHVNIVPLLGWSKDGMTPCLV